MALTVAWLGAGMLRRCCCCCLRPTLPLLLQLVLFVWLLPGQSEAGQLSKWRLPVAMVGERRASERQGGARLAEEAAATTPNPAPRAPGRRTAQSRTSARGGRGRVARRGRMSGMGAGKAKAVPAEESGCLLSCPPRGEVLR